jgi:NAD-dependent DNA ligase
VVTSATTMRADLLKEELERKENKDKDTIDMKQKRKTLEAELEGDKVGAGRISEDELEAFFTRRERKQELLRGKTTQPGQSTFYVAGETRDRSVPHVKHYIVDHGGVVSDDLTEKVDYVVAGAGLDKAFYDQIKKLGVKIIREDELPKFFGRDR